MGCSPWGPPSLGSPIKTIKKDIRTEVICIFSDLMGLLWTNLEQFKIFLIQWGP